MSVARKSKQKLVYPDWPVGNEIDALWEAESNRLHNLYNFERDLWSIGYQNIVGLDEAGRGPLAGPVVAAAVILPGGLWLPGLNDSKKLSPSQRAELARLIKANAIAYSVTEVGVEYIDKFNIREASLEAMRLAIKALLVVPDYVLVDGMYVPGLKIPQTTIIRGDSLSASIAAASILAKVTRDELMISFEEKYPGYGFSQHKGYATAKHLEALNRLGPSPIHRWSFAPVQKASQEKS